MKVTVWCDGGCRKNGSPDAEGYASVRIVGKQNTIHRTDLSAKTNHQAELGALGFAMELLLPAFDYPGLEVEIRTDSLNAIGWCFGNFQCKTAELLPLRDYVRSALQEYAEAGIKITAVHVPRTEIVERLGH